MNKRNLQPKRALRSVLFVLLLSAVGMTKALAQTEGALNGVFTINDSGDKVCFSQGNLQYKASTNTWRFAEYQGYIIGYANENISSTYDGWIDLFGWGTSGWNHGDCTYYHPWDSNFDSGATYGPPLPYDLTGSYENADWGVYNRISNGGNATTHRWRTLTRSEWGYLLQDRSTSSGIRYAKAWITMGSQTRNGIILLPDNWTASTFNLNNTNNAEADYYSNVISSSQWTILENAGAVFLPAAGTRRNGTGIYGVNSYGFYWTTTHYYDYRGRAYNIEFFDSGLITWGDEARKDGLSVRLVCDVFNIGASVNPVQGGTVSGNGTYTYGQNCTLTAIANQGYTFINWTHNGNVVSTSATYNFTPTENMQLVANFADSQVVIAAVADPEEGGAITGDGNYDYGASVTLTAVASSGYVFVNWTENGDVVSSNTTFSFTATTSRNLVAHFSEFVNHWTPETSLYEDNMTLTCIVQLDGVEQATTMLELGAFCGTQCRGSQRATFFAPSDHYIFQMIVFGESNDMISFRLYDHLTQQELMLTPPTPITFNSNGYGSLFNPYVLNFTSNVLISAEASPAGAGTITGAGEYPIGTEVTLTAVANMGYQFVNWMLDGEVVSTSPSYQFTVTEAADFVANFGCVHTQALNSGWNWWSTYIELTDNNGLSQLENSLGNAGILIKSRANGYVEAYQYNGATNWYGTLTSINNEQMYKVRTNANCNAIISGSFALPESHPVTIKNGWNWIGFPCNQNVSVDVAMSGFTPEANDVIKGRNGFTTYYSDENYSMWYGTLNTLEPGRGYMYRSNSTTQKTLVFQTGRGETTMENVTTENNIFQPADGDFADNMTITAVLELDGEELRSDDYELAAFVGDECRGSVKLMYVEPVNRYVAFLTVFGEPSETLYFRLTDGTQTELSMDEITFAADGMEGTLSEPMTLRFGTTKLDENELSKVLVYPNPSNGVFNIQGQGIRKIEVFNAFGQVVVSEETSNDHLQIDLSRYADGCYMLRVVTDNGITNRQMIKK